MTLSMTLLIILVEMCPALLKLLSPQGTSIKATWQSLYPANTDFVTIAA